MESGVFFLVVFWNIWDFTGHQWNLQFFRIRDLFGCFIRDPFRDFFLWPPFGWSNGHLEEAGCFCFFAWHSKQRSLRIQVCPKKGINLTILLWGWDWDHQSYTREGSGFLGDMCFFSDENYQLWRLWLFICLLWSRKTTIFMETSPPPKKKEQQHGNQVCPKQNHSWTASDWFCSWAEVIKCDSSDFCQACLENAACNM